MCRALAHRAAANWWLFFVSEGGGGVGETENVKIEQLREASGEVSAGWRGPRGQVRLPLPAVYWRDLFVVVSVVGCRARQGLVCDDTCTMSNQLVGETFGLGTSITDPDIRYELG